MNAYKKIIIFGVLIVFYNIGHAASINTIKPYRGSIQKSFTEPAKTRLENIYSINMPIAGKLERIIIKEGDKVSENQVVARLVQEPLIQAVNKAKARLNTINLQYDLQRKTLKRYEDLSKKSFIDEAQLDEARAQEKVLAAQIVESKAELAIALYDLKESTLRSPIDGIVLNRYTQGGKWLQTGELLLEIGNLRELDVICDVLTQEAQEVTIGDPVFLTSIGSPIILEGRVKQIYPAGFTKQSSLGVDEQRVNIIVGIINPERAHLGVGYRVQAEFLVGTREKNALIIPRFSVLQDEKGNHYVFVVRNNKLHKRIIKLGILTDENIAVIKGLTTSDTIVEQPTADMHDGMSS